VRTDIIARQMQVQEEEEGVGGRRGSGGGGRREGRAGGRGEGLLDDDSDSLVPRLKGQAKTQDQGTGAVPGAVPGAVFRGGARGSARAVALQMGQPGVCRWVHRGRRRVAGRCWSRWSWWSLSLYPSEAGPVTISQAATEGRPGLSLWVPMVHLLGGSFNPDRPLSRGPPPESE